MMLSRKRRTNIRKKKRISIVPFQINHTLPENFEDEAWNELENTLHCIFEDKPLEAILEELYKKVHTLCQHGKSQTIFKKLVLQCENYVNKLHENITNAKSNDPQTVLSFFNLIWKSYIDHMIQMRNIFKVLDTEKAAFEGKVVTSLWDMALFIFRNKVMSPESKSSHYEYIEKNSLNYILHDRRDNFVDRSQLKTTVDMFIQLQVYHKFENKLLLSTRDYHQRNAREKLHSLPIASYIKMCDTLITAEESRCLSYLPQSVLPKLKSIIFEEYITNYIHDILNKGLALLILKKNYDVLSSMYILFVRGKGLPAFKEKLYDYLYETGRKLIENKAHDKAMVDNLLEYYHEIIHIQKTSFNTNIEFGKAIREAFLAFVKTRGHVPSILVAKYLDTKLQKGTKELPDIEFTALIDRVFEIFYFCPGKDIFEMFYKRGLARRLLLKKSANREHEKYIIKRLRQECGSSIAKKLQVMFKDIASSEILNEGYQKSTFVKHQGIEFYTNVISTGDWPSFDATPLTMPPIIKDLETSFQNYYVENNSSRVLNWVPMLGSCVILGLFKNNPNGISLSSSVFQGLVMMYCNDHNTFSFNDLMKYMGIQEVNITYINELRRTLVSLTHSAKRAHRLLQVTNRDIDLSAKTIQNEDVFQLNVEYSRKSSKVSLPLPQMKETQKESKEMEEKALFDRTYVIQATIVRIMKLSKKLNHRDLFLETAKQIAGRFTVVQRIFKQSIESLIDSAYIKRADDDPKTYIYIS